MRWMNLELITQSEVSQKEKDKYCILTHMYGIQKNGTEEFIYRATIEKQTQNRLMDMGRGEERVKYMERITWKLTLPYVKQPLGICYMAQETQTVALYQSRGMGCGKRWEGVSEGREYMYTYG